MNCLRRQELLLEEYVIVVSKENVCDRIRTVLSKLSYQTRPSDEKLNQFANTLSCFVTSKQLENMEIVLKPDGRLIAASFKEWMLSYPMTSTLTDRVSLDFPFAFSNLVPREVVEMAIAPIVAYFLPHDDLLSKKIGDIVSEVMQAPKPVRFTLAMRDTLVCML